MGDYVSKKYANSDYAPGIATYGVDGKSGTSGKNGTSVFVCQYDIFSEDSEKIVAFGNAIR